MGDLAEQLLSLPSRVTRQIRRLEDAGLVRREASPEDGRGVLASITDQGRDVVAAAMVTYSEAVRQRFLASVDPAADCLDGGELPSPECGGESQWRFRQARPTLTRALRLPALSDSPRATLAGSF